MMGTFNCVYETPCGWCSKWDKKCDRKIPELGKRTNTVVEDIVKSKAEAIVPCQSDSDHEWECITGSTVGSIHRCKKCKAYKTYMAKNDSTTISYISNSI